MVAPDPQQDPPLRQGRWTAQWWAATFSIITSIASVIAVIISLSVLAISKQQQADAVQQRDEDQREKQRAFAQRITYQRVSKESAREPRVLIRNANATSATVIIYISVGPWLTTAAPFVLKACSQTTYQVRRTPDSDLSLKGALIDILVLNPIDRKWWTGTLNGQLSADRPQTKYPRTLFAADQNGEKFSVVTTSRLGSPAFHSTMFAQSRLVRSCHALE
ncbi:hypothetical protein [Nonomuraea sp. KM90]|uniref:hypothetical protein n=1 Tax=Nonomuraea sp. KM90 TaxID=3457428 RepID=UPI003FCDFD80